MFLFRQAHTLALPQPAQSSKNRPVQSFGVVAVVDESGADLEDCEHTQSILSAVNAIRAVKKNARASSTRHRSIAFAIILIKNKRL